MKRLVVYLLVAVNTMALTSCHDNRMLVNRLQSHHKVINFVNIESSNVEEVAKTEPDPKPKHKVSDKASITHVVSQAIKNTQQASRKYPVTHVAVKTHPIPMTSSRVKQALLNQYKEWKGVRYRLGGQSKHGIDCSGFIQNTFRNKFNITLPRDTSKQAHIGKYIKKRHLRMGDLVFFKTGRRVRHVGVYLDKHTFLHASTRKGVIISNINDVYWSKHYWKAQRIAGI